MTTQRYNVQCINHGFCGDVGPENPELYKKCQEREAKGFLDALCLGPDNTFCYDCREGNQKRRQQDLEYLAEIQEPRSSWYIEDKEEREAKVAEVKAELEIE